AAGGGRPDWLRWPVQKVAVAGVGAAFVLGHVALVARFAAVSRAIVIARCCRRRFCSLYSWHRRSSRPPCLSSPALLTLPSLAVCSLPHFPVRNSASSSS
ncbi:hypothetical protein HN873_048786, partial [Arachis hypogaea]